MLIGLFVQYTSATVSFYKTWPRSHTASHTAHWWFCDTPSAVHCLGSCRGLCFDVRAAVICSLLSWLCGPSLEMFSKLKNSRRYISKMQAPGVIYLNLRSGAEGRKGIAARCTLHMVLHPGCAGQASPVLHHQPADAFRWKCCFDFPCRWISSQSLAGAIVQPCWRWACFPCRGSVRRRVERGSVFFCLCK